MVDDDDVFFIFIDETREPSWETEGTFYSIVGVCHPYVLKTSLAFYSIFVSSFAIETKRKDMILRALALPCFHRL